MLLNPSCCFTHTIPARTILDEETRLRTALQTGGHPKAEAVPLHAAAIGSLVQDLHDMADDLSIEDYSVDYATDCDGNLSVALSFGYEADMVLFRLRTI